MSGDFTKVRMIQDGDYEHCRNHECSECGNKCNESIFETNDDLNKTYSDIISSDDRTEESAEVLNSEVDHNNAEATHDQHPVETHDEASSYINDSQGVSNNAERVSSNPPDMNVPLNQVSNLSNVATAENAPQVFPESTASAVNSNLNSTPPIPVIAQNDVSQVYNCAPDAATISPGKAVPRIKSFSKNQKPYQCPLCPKTYKTPNSVNRHIKEKHRNSAVKQLFKSKVQQPTAPVVPQPTGQNYPKLIEINGSPVTNEEEEVINEKDVPLPDSDDDLQFSLSDDNDDLPTPSSSKKNIPKIRLDPLRRTIPKATVNTTYKKKRRNKKIIPKSEMIKAAYKKKKRNKKIIPKSDIITRQKRKRNEFDSDNEENPSKVVITGKGRGGHFYSSWD